MTSVFFFSVLAVFIKYRQPIIQEPAAKIEIVSSVSFLLLDRGSCIGLGESSSGRVICGSRLGSTGGCRRLQSSTSNLVGYVCRSRMFRYRKSLSREKEVELADGWRALDRWANGSDTRRRRRRRDVMLAIMCMVGLRVSLVV